jgi:hypothetical protein
MVADMQLTHGPINSRSEQLGAVSVTGWQLPPQVSWPTPLICVRSAAASVILTSIILVDTKDITSFRQQQ